MTRNNFAVCIHSPHPPKSSPKFQKPLHLGVDAERQSPRRIHRIQNSWKRWRTLRLATPLQSVYIQPPEILPSVRKPPHSGVDTERQSLRCLHQTKNCWKGVEPYYTQYFCSLHTFSLPKSSPMFQKLPHFEVYMELQSPRCMHRTKNCSKRWRTLFRAGSLQFAYIHPPQNPCLSAKNHPIYKLTRNSKVHGAFIELKTVGNSKNLYWSQHLCSLHTFDPPPQNPSLSSKNIPI